MISLAGLALMIAVPGGSYVPFVAGKNEKKTVTVESFRLDRDPATRAEFAEFVRAVPEWRRSRVPGIFADARYLDDWSTELVPGGNLRAPVVRVSWFAASAYCEWRGKRLPSTDEWEYAADDRGRDREGNTRRILEWYGSPGETRIPEARSSTANGYGIRGLYDLVWEWTEDFNAAIAPNESQFCGAGSLGAVNPADYASFMRFSLRASLKASYTTANLGVRCAR